MTIKEHRIQITALFTALILCILLMAVLFWNKGLKAHLAFGIWPVIFLILSLIAASGFMVLYLGATDTKKLHAIIQEKVTDERSKLLAELEKKKEPEAAEQEKSDIDVQKIIPSGNFKTEESFANKLLANLSNNAQVSIGIYYHFDNKSKKFRYLTGFAFTGKNPPADFKPGENLNGQVAESKQLMILKNVPESYFTIESGLGKSKPRNIVIAPIVNNNRTIAIIEIATFIEADTRLEKMINEVCLLSAKKLEQINKSLK